MHGAKGHRPVLSPESEPALSIAAYSVCSVSMILVNKLVMDTYGIDHPMGLLFLQNLCALLIVAAAKHFGYVAYPDFDVQVVRKWLPLTVLFVLMLFTSLKSLKLMSVAVQTILKNLATILTAYGDHRIFGKELTRPMVGAFGLMVVGSVLGTSSDAWVTGWGLFWTFANVFATVAYVLYMKTLLGSVSQEIGRYGPVFYSNLLSLPFFFVPSAVTLPALLRDIAAAPAGAKACVFLMFSTGGLMTFAVFWCMRVTSPTTYSVVGSLNKIPLALLGMVIFKHMPSAVGAVGICAALSGGMLYTYLNLPRPKPRDEPVRV
jgi:GDP-mannose transporter